MALKNSLEKETECGESSQKVVTSINSSVIRKEIHILESFQMQLPSCDQLFKRNSKVRGAKLCVS